MIQNSGTKKLNRANLIIFVGAILALWSKPALAQSQIVPDETLGDESSQVRNNVEVKGIPSEVIEGGAQRGANLFHSFSEFNVSEGRGAYFANPAGIEHILGRVTGANPSEILGTLGVLGNADLFLINPNGIIFGENARLDVAGSFVGTTANEVRLGETGLFSASEPQKSNLLAVNPSALFFNAMAAQSIVSRSQALGIEGETNSVATPVGLQVPPGQTLALVGGDVFLEGGNLTAAGGRIELGSVAGNGVVSLTQSEKHWILEYDSIDRFGNIKLENGAVVDAGTRGGGEIQIQTARLLVQDGARITNRPLVGQESGGNITLNASNSVELKGVAWSANNNMTLPGGVFAGSLRDGGNSGNITIFTQKLTVSDGAAISGAALNGRNGGDLTIDASKSVELIGIGVGVNPEAGGQELFISNLGIGAYSNPNTETLGGEAGNLRINTQQLAIRDGAAIVTAAVNGLGGDSAINATESVILSGTSSFTSLEENSEAIEVPSALFADSIVRVSDFANQEPNSLQIDTRSLLVEKGAVISASTLGQVRGGDITINASESIRLDGVSVSGFPSGLYAQSFNTAIGGNLNINTGELTLNNGARIAVAADNLEEFVVFDTIQIILGITLPTQNLEQLISENQGIGDAGNIDIAARSILINEEGQIAASSNSGNGGDISFQGQGQQNLDLLVLRNESQISTEAGTEETDGNGGNININTNFLIASPLENSDIIANAFEGNGGNINIAAQDIFGIEFRERQTSFSDITASSEFGLQGTVEINTPDIDPNRGLIQLPTQPIETEVAQACTPGSSQGQSEFFITGRGGLPPNPNETLSSDAIGVDLATLDSDAAGEQRSRRAGEIQRRGDNETRRRREDLELTTPSSSQSKVPAGIREAQGMVADRNGEVLLVGSAPQTMTSLSSPQAERCLPF